jgi:curved DNA-binding protein CbpA
MYHVPDLARAKRISQQAAEQMALNEAALRKDYYKLLGLDKGRVSENEIRRAWRDSLLKYHPDKVGEDDRTRRIIIDINAVRLIL